MKMNKKEAIAYAQITLNHMQSVKYDREINLRTFAIEMKQTMKEYPRNIVLEIAKAQVYAEQKLETMKNESDI